IGYWTDVLTAPVGSLPVDGSAGADDTYGGAEWVTVQADEALTALLLGPAHRACGAEINDLLLTARGRARGQPQRITLEGHGRDALDGIDLSGAVGWFTSIFPLRLALPDADVEAQIDAVRRTLRRVPRKGIGYGLLRYANAAPLLPHREPEISVNY